MDIDFREGIFHFCWAVCEDGYNDMHGRRWSEGFKFLEPKSTRFKYYNPEKEFPDLLFNFLKTELSYEGIREFTEQFGALGISADWDTGELLDSGVGKRVFSPTIGQNIASFIELHKRISSAMAAIKLRNEAIKQNNESKAQKAQSQISLAFSSSINPRLTLGIDTDNVEDIKFCILPASLSDYIEVLVTRELAGGFEWRKCANPKCDVTFPIAIGRGALVKRGVGTKRKETCGKSACKKALTRLRQKQKKEAQDGKS
tara:strand:+ start:249 stop:1022 length:774 start_codon:yes stop_codon:yes gene_type:complete